MIKQSTRLALASLVGVMAVSGGAALAQDATPEATPEMTQPEMVAERPYVGVMLLTDESGAVMIGNVVPGSPAEAAGVQVGDVIVAVNGAEIATAEDVVTLVAAQAVGDVLTLDVERNGDPMSIEVTLAALPNDIMLEVRPFDGRGPGRGERGERGGRGDGMPGFPGMPDMHMMPGMPNMRMMPGHDLMFMMMSGAGRLGVTFQTLDESLAADYDVTLSDGAYIVEVAADSPAAEAGLETGDVVTAVNAEPVDAERTLRDRLIAYEPGDTVTLTVVRGEETLDLTVTLGEQQAVMLERGPLNRDGDGGFHFFMPPMEVTPEVAPEAAPEATAEANA